MNLQDVIAMYLTYKNALGMEMRSERRILEMFCRRMNNSAIADVTSDAVLVFLNGKGPITNHWKQKASVLRSFYRYLIGRGFADSSPLPLFQPQFPSTRIPYIYSTIEIQDLLEATAVLSTRQSPFRGPSFRGLLLLLYSTGMRLNEALSLTLDDVDLLNGVITIRDTKFHKTRLVPIGPKLTCALSNFAGKRRRRIPMPAGQDSAFLTITRTGMTASVAVAEELFDRLRRIVGLAGKRPGRGQPYLHDLRHTMVQHHMIAWYRSGQDVQRLLPQLATYLGHVNISSTQTYLTMTPELLEEAGRRFAQYAQPENSNAQ